jgi:hypothetical protein
MAKRFLLFTFEFADKDPKLEELKPIFDKATDWLRIMPHSWLVWTSGSMETWYQRVRKVVKDEDEVFITPVEAKGSQGWISKSVWDWIGKERAE